MKKGLGYRLHLIQTASILAGCALTWTACLTPNEMMMTESRFYTYRFYKPLVAEESRREWSKPKGKIGALDKNALSNLSLDSACYAYANLDPWLLPAARQQLLDTMVDKGFQEGELDLLESKKIRIGMTKECLYAIKGKPHDWNRTVSTAGVSIQHIYGRFPSATYYYTDNGVLTSWSD